MPPTPRLYLPHLLFYLLTADGQCLMLSAVIYMAGVEIRFLNPGASRSHTDQAQVSGIRSRLRVKPLTLTFILIDNREISCLDFLNLSNGQRGLFFFYEGRSYKVV